MAQAPGVPPQVAPSATLVAVGLRLGMVFGIVAYHSLFQQYGGWFLTLPMSQLTTLGAIGGFLYWQGRRTQAGAT